jgi:hypothetical protein
MVTSEERMQILNMIAEGKITAEEGARLLAALGPARKPERPGAPPPPGAPRWFRVRVTDLETGRTKVNVNLPMSLVQVGIKMGAHFAPGTEGIDFQDVVDQIKSGAQGKVMDYENAEDGERVEIYVE